MLHVIFGHLGSSFGFWDNIFGLVTSTPPLGTPSQEHAEAACEAAEMVTGELQEAEVLCLGLARVESGFWGDERLPPLGP